MNRWIAALTLGVLAHPAHAQDPEYYDSEVTTESDGPLWIEGSFETEWHEYSNLDFRALDESSDQAILDSDDRGGFPYTGARLELAYEVESRVRFNLGVSHRGLWGSDQLGNADSFGGFVYVGAMNVDVEANDWLRFTVGRQYYRLGALSGSRDYILSDTLDMVRADILFGVGVLELIPVNVIEQTDNDGLDFVKYIGTADLPTFNFRGDTMMRRHGAVLRLDRLLAVPEFLLYGFYTDIGAGVSAPELGLFSSGVDISYQGLLGNFTDNDWVANFGVRAGLRDVPVRPYAHFDLSRGIDRKELVARDVDTNGVAWGAGSVFETGDAEAGLRAQLSYFEALGPAYGSDGLLFSHGYVGMKGQHVGGLLFNRFLGFHPTAYVSLFGVTDTPNEPSRRSGTRALHAQAGQDFGTLRLDLRYWFLQDTGISQVNLKKLDTIDPPFGYAREEFAAQERLGKVIGQELNLDVRVEVTEQVDLTGGAAVILPGPYYAIEVARVAGDALGSSDPAMPWGGNLGMKVRF